MTDITYYILKFSTLDNETFVFRFRGDELVGGAYSIEVDSLSKSNWSNRTAENTLAVFHTKNYKMSDILTFIKSEYGDWFNPSSTGSVRRLDKTGIENINLKR